MPEIGRPVTSEQSQLMKAEILKPKLDKEVVDKIAGTTRNDRSKLFAKKDPSKLDKDDFLKMLSNQIQNQDPLNPADQKQFTQELAQFSQLEQMTNLNKKFETWAGNRELEKKLSAAQFVGKRVVTEGNSITHGQEGRPPGAKIVFNLDRNAKEVIVRVNDKGGNLTAEIPMSNQGSGSHEVDWNGKATDGYPAPPGEYQVSIKAWDENLKTIIPETRVGGLVEGVYFDGDEIMLTVEGRKVSLKDVKSFHEGNKSVEKQLKAFQTEATNPLLQKVIENQQQQQQLQQKQDLQAQALQQPIPSNGSDVDQPMTLDENL